MSGRPHPLVDFWQVGAVLIRVIDALDLPVAQRLFGVCTGCLKRWDAVNDIHGEAEAVDLVLDGQIEGRVDVAFFLVAAHVQVVVIGAPISEPVNQPGIPMEVEDDGLVFGEEAVEVFIGEPVRVFGAGDQTVQIDHIDEADFEIREVLAEEAYGGQRFFGGNVAGAGHHDIGFHVLVVAGSLPDAEALGAVDDGFVHGHVLQVLLLVRHDDVDVAGAAEAMVGDADQRVGVGRQVDAADLGTLVHHDDRGSRDPDG